MNNNYLFHGKRLDNGEWVEGYIYISEISGVYILQNTLKKSRNARTGSITMRDVVIQHEVDPTTVGQYTGKNDRNQHRAFVGDVVRYHNEHHTVYGIIHFGEITDTEGQSKHIGYYIEWQNDGANTWGDWWRSDLGYWLDDQHCEICGNIYDNPELMGGENDG